VPDEETSGAVLTIDLDAIVANWRLLRDRVAPAACAGVVKADAYGTGAAKVAPALARAGCHTFFVAHIDEGVRLRALLPDAAIHILNGPFPGTGPVFAEHRLIPVLNSLGAIEMWAGFARERETAMPADVHIDTGMSRLGLPADELETLATDPSRLDGIEVVFIMSHLACADEPDHPLNRRQIEEFGAALAALPAAAASLTNSSGIFLGADYHFDVARPGICLYGGAPSAGPNPMAQVVTLQGKILQVRSIDTPRTVGYGATWEAPRTTRIATVAVGYADGYLRSLSGSASGYVGDIRVPLVGRVSMDLITFDVSDVPEHRVRPGSLIDLIGPHYPIDHAARDAGTISYEIITSLGARYHRAYTGGRGA
jgi:alanine racemase